MEELSLVVITTACVYWRPGVNNPQTEAQTEEQTEAQTEEQTEAPTEAQMGVWATKHQGCLSHLLP